MRRRTLLMLALLLLASLTLACRGAELENLIEQLLIESDQAEPLPEIPEQ